MIQDPYQRRYQASEKGRATRAAYKARNRERIRADWRRWSKTDKGRAAMRRNNASAARRASKAAWKVKRQLALDAIKLERGCIDCGYRGHPAALDFDHRDPAQKSFVVSGVISRAWSSIVAEIAKCDVRCANCHRVRTVTEGHHRAATPPGIAPVDQLALDLGGAP